VCVATTKQRSQAFERAPLEYLLIFNLTMTLGEVRGIFQLLPIIALGEWAEGHHEYKGENKHHKHDLNQRADEQAADHSNPDH
jgi:hypothetical protein